jgi:hypothetical protein
MTLKELGNCEHVRRRDRIVEFKKNGETYHAICPKCGSSMHWDNWTKLYEPLRAKCTSCGLFQQSVELNFEQVTPSNTHQENINAVNHEL